MHAFSFLQLYITTTAHASTHSFTLSPSLHFGFKSYAALSPLSLSHTHTHTSLTNTGSDICVLSLACPLSSSKSSSCFSLVHFDSELQKRRRQVEKELLNCEKWSICFQSSLPLLFLYWRCSFCSDQSKLEIGTSNFPLSTDSEATVQSSNEFDI